MNESEARAAVLAVLAERQDSGQNVLRASPFSDGWLIWFERADGEATFGGSTYVVDGQDGTVRSFASSLSPRRLAADYQTLKSQTAPLSPSA